MKKVYLCAGEIAIATEPSLITTVLGSCVATCLWDKRLMIGGINHFKMPYALENKPHTNMYGNISMANLIGGLLKAGSKKSDLRAMIFGGGTVIPCAPGIDNIGAENARMAIDTLKEAGIVVVTNKTCQPNGSKVIFNTSDGSARLSKVSSLTHASLNGQSSR